MVVKQTLLWIALCIVCLESSLVNCATDNETLPKSDERRLVADLLNRYRVYGKVARPLVNSSGPLDVHFGLRLMHLEIDEGKQTLQTSVWKRVTWHDELLEWDKDEYGGHTHVVLPQDQIWLPDIALANTASTDDDERRVDPQVRYDGKVFWTPQQLYSSACFVDLNNFPYDEHTCHMWFQSISQLSSMIDLLPYSYMESVPLDVSTYLGEYKDSAEWEILHHECEYVRRPRDQGVILMYSRRVSLRFSLTVRRRPGFKAMLLTLPCVVLSLLTVVVFALSPERPDRHMLAMGLFGSFMVLLLVLTETAPPTAASVPRLGMYYAFNLLLIISSIFVSTCIVNIYKLGELKKRVPGLVKNVFFKVLATPLLMRDRVEHLDLMKERTDVKAASDNSDSCHPDSDRKAQSSEVASDPLLIGMNRQMEQLQSIVIQMHAQSQPRAMKGNYLVAAWKLVALMLDRIFMFVYLAMSIALLAIYYPRPF